MSFSLLPRGGVVPELGVLNATEGILANGSMKATDLS